METSYYTTPWPSDLCYEDILPTYVETLSISQWTLYYLYVETLSQIEHFTTCMIIIDKPLFTVILKIYYTGNGAEIRMVLGVALHLLGDLILPMPRSYNATFIQCHFYTMPPLYNATFIQYISFNIYLKVDFFT